MVHDDIPSHFFEEDWITNVDFIVSSGKEGTVYACLAGDRTPHDYLAVKIYTERKFRSFKNASVYLTGRSDVSRDGTGRTRAGGKPDRRMERAIAKKSRAGKQHEEFGWISHEFYTMDLLHRMGAIVPEPFLIADRAILMEFVGNEEGAAPRLKDVILPAGDGRRHFRTLMEQIELWLANGRIHGDLSPFNILYWQGEMVVIDFPQAVDPAENPDALWLLERDIANVAGYFESYGFQVDPSRVARDMWRQHVRW